MIGREVKTRFSEKAQAIAWCRIRVEMTRNAVERVNWLVVHKDLFRDWFLSNPWNLREELQRAVSGLDKEDVAAIAVAVAESNRNALKYFKGINEDLDRRYPKYPKPPRAV